VKTPSSPSTRAKKGNPFAHRPKTINPKSTLTINFLVSYARAAPLPRSQSDEGDYRHVAKVFHRVLVNPAEHPADDVCPHDALATVPNPDGKLKDNGCGTKQRDGTFASAGDQRGALRSRAAQEAARDLAAARPHGRPAAEARGSLCDRRSSHPAP
jgi:hypothetical protein